MPIKVYKAFFQGPSSPFQRKAGFYAIILLFVLMSLFGGPYFASENWRRIWLGAFLATALFLPFYYVHGKSMLVLSLVSTVNVVLGYAFPELPLVYTAYADAAIKLGFGVYLFCFSKPSKQKLKRWDKKNRYRGRVNQRTEIQKRQERIHPAFSHLVHRIYFVPKMRSPASPRPGSM